MFGTLLKSFGYAFAGIGHFFRTERNARVHLLAAIVVIIISFILNITTDQWLWISLSICLVVVAEMINTAIEKLCNRITTAHDAEIKVIKDISAGFVLITSLFACVVAAIIFIPYLL